MNGVMDTQVNSSSVLGKRKVEEHLQDTSVKFVAQDVTVNNDETMSSVQTEQQKIPNYSSKHLVKRDADKWEKPLGYLNPNIFSSMFEESVIQVVQGIKNHGWQGAHVVSFFEQRSQIIAQKRGIHKYEKFGTSRLIGYELYRTSIRLGSPYDDALPKAIAQQNDGKHAISDFNEAGEIVIKALMTGRYPECYRDQLFLGWYVTGYIDQQPIPLTQYLFLIYQELKIPSVFEGMFGTKKSLYLYDEVRQKLLSGSIIHSDNGQIRTCMPHII